MSNKNNATASAAVELVSNHVMMADTSPSPIPISTQQLQLSGKSTIFPDDIQTIKAKNPKMDFNKAELLKLLCYMEGELQARDVVIAVLKVKLSALNKICYQ